MELCSPLRDGILGTWCRRSRDGVPRSCDETEQGRSPDRQHTANITDNGGAYAITEPVDAYWADRTASLSDPFGHVWSVASRIEHVSREEIQRRSAAIFLPDSATETGILAETLTEVVAEGEYAQGIAA